MTDRGGIWLKTLLRKITHMAAEPSRSTTFDTSIATMAGDNGGADATSVPPPMPNQGGYDYAVGATAAAPAMMLPPTHHLWERQLLIKHTHFLKHQDFQHRVRRLAPRCTR